MLHTKFRENGLPVLEKKIFDFTIYGRGGHLGHVTQMPQQTFIPPTQGDST